MFLRADEPVNASDHGVMLCMNTPDLAGLREQLLAAGVRCLRSDTRNICRVVRSVLPTRMATP